MSDRPVVGDGEKGGRSVMMERREEGRQWRNGKKKRRMKG